MEDEGVPMTRFPEDSDDEQSPSPPKRKGRGKAKKQPEESEMRTELISLAERGEISHTVSYIKKATDAALEKIMVKYKQDQTDAVNEVLVNTILSKFTELMDITNMVDDGKEMGKELGENELLRKDLKSLVSHVTPYIPYIGILTGGMIVAGHIWSKSSETPSDNQEQV